MALDPLPSEITVKDRAAWLASYLRSIRLRNPTASTLEGTQPYVDGSALADQLVVLSANARQVGRRIPLSECSGDQLDQRAAEKGIPPRYPEVGAVGYVQVATSAGGSTILSGDELTEPNSQMRFRCTATKLYSNGDWVPVAGIATGPSTNLAADTVLLWSAPRPGCLVQAVIVEQNDGTGLSGGRLAESDDELRQRISDAEADPAASGNDAAYQRAIENSLAHGVAVQKAFTYPCVSGPGTIGCAFTMRRTAPGASRVPNVAQTTLVRDYVVGLAPKDDSYIDLIMLSQPVDVVLDVQWANGAGDWYDVVPWPARYATGSGAIVVTAVSNALSFTLGKDNGGSYAGVTPPAVGQTIGFYNPSGAKFSRKRIASVSGVGPWDCTADTTNAASDTEYTPVVGQRAMPWSDSLDSLVSPILDHFNTLGPGEMFATFFDPGLRQKRSPPSPTRWPHTISNRLAGDLLDPDKSPAVGDCVIREGLGVAATIGTPGATVYLLELGDLAAFKY